MGKFKKSLVIICFATQKSKMIARMSCSTRSGNGVFLLLYGGATHVVAFYSILRLLKILTHSVVPGATRLFANPSGLTRETRCLLFVEWNDTLITELSQRVEDSSVRKKTERICDVEHLNFQFGSRSWSLFVLEPHRAACR